VLWARGVYKGRKRSLTPTQVQDLHTRVVGRNRSCLRLVVRTRQPDPNRFGMTMTTNTQTVWLDNPGTVVRIFETGDCAANGVSGPTRRAEMRWMGTVSDDIGSVEVTTTRGLVMDVAG